MRIITPDKIETFDFNLSVDGTGITGIAMKIGIQRVSDSKWWDGDSWETGYPVTPVAMTEVDSTNLKGLYRYTGIAVVNMAAGDRYNIRYYNTDSTYGMDISEVVGVEQVNAEGVSTIIASVNATRIKTDQLQFTVAGFLKSDIEEIHQKTIVAPAINWITDSDYYTYGNYFNNADVLTFSPATPGRVVRVVGSSGYLKINVGTANQLISVEGHRGTIELTGSGVGTASFTGIGNIGKFIAGGVYIATMDGCCGEFVGTVGEGGCFLNGGGGHCSITSAVKSGFVDTPSIQVGLGTLANQNTIINSVNATRIQTDKMNFTGLNIQAVVDELSSDGLNKVVLTRTAAGNPLTYTVGTGDNLKTVEVTYETIDGVERVVSEEILVGD